LRLKFRLFAPRTSLQARAPIPRAPGDKPWSARAICWAAIGLSSVKKVAGRPQKLVRHFTAQ